jgi:LysM repeat protein
MSELVKAYLAEITPDANPREVPDTKVDVQFNPTSLRVQISNKTAGGQQAGAQARQRPGTGEMQVSFDLVFDSADEGETDAGVSVLDKTKMVERFVRPRGPRQGEEAPPRVVFVWGSFMVQGVMESANLDLDLFDSQGVPLRAKVAVSIKGQDPNWAYKPSPTSPTSKVRQAPAGGPRSPNQTTLPPGAPGTTGDGLSPDRIVQAMPGESLAQLAQRAGFDPAAWRALANGLSNPLKLELGQEVPLPPNGGIGAAAGTAAQGIEPGRMATSLPLVPGAQATQSGEGSSDPKRNLRPAAADPVRQGIAVTSRGGLQGAITGIKETAHQQGASIGLAAFGLDSQGSAETDGRPWGMGVPLRPKFGSAKSARRQDPTQAGWSMRPLPAGRASASLASVAPLRTPRWSRRSGCGCGCSDCHGHTH